MISFLKKVFCVTAFFEIFILFQELITPALILALVVVFYTLIKAEIKTKEKGLCK